MKNVSLLLSLIMTISIIPSLANASAPQTLGSFGPWKAFMATENEQPVCYMSLTSKAPPIVVPKTAKKSQAKPSKRGDVVIMVTHRPAEGSKDVVSYSAGIKFKAASEAKIIIGKKEFSLFTQNDTAWSRDAATDHALAAAIKGGLSITMSGESARGDIINDKINIKGAAQAYRAISKSCGLPVEAEKPVVAPKPAKAKPASTAKPATAIKTPAKAVAPNTAKKTR
ncbi:MAG: invasion associated locus B family protein [Alphaproteobacteria bacterium]|nr:invasion associated locus B family protein [Alphaproteobacteria bacterium]